jgi:hypothetical protein
LGTVPLVTPRCHRLAPTVAATLIERYARAAMREWEWYTNMPDEDPAMPGTFAVFALALADDAYLPLAHEYLELCDDEYQHVHAKLVEAYVEKNGFTPAALELFVACAGRIQELPPKKLYAAVLQDG